MTHHSSLCPSKTPLTSGHELLSNNCSLQSSIFRYRYPKASLIMWYFAWRTSKTDFDMNRTHKHTRGCLITTLSFTHLIIHLFTILSFKPLLLQQEPKILTEMVQIWNGWRFEKASERLLRIWSKVKVFVPNLTKITSQKKLVSECPQYTSCFLFNILIKTPDSLQTGLTPGCSPQAFLPSMLPHYSIWYFSDIKNKIQSYTLCLGYFTHVSYPHLS